MLAVTDLIWVVLPAWDKTLAFHPEIFSWFFYFFLLLPQSSSFWSVAKSLVGLKYFSLRRKFFRSRNEAIEEAPYLPWNFNWSTGFLPLYILTWPLFIEFKGRLDESRISLVSSIEYHEIICKKVVRNWWSIFARLGSTFLQSRISSYNWDLLTKTKTQQILYLVKLMACCRKGKKKCKGKERLAWLSLIFLICLTFINHQYPNFSFFLS